MNLKQYGILLMFLGIGSYLPLAWFNLIKLFGDRLFDLLGEPVIIWFWRTNGILFVVVGAGLYFTGRARIRAAQPLAATATYRQAQSNPRPPASSGSNFCGNCGSAVSPGAKFCFSCGTPLT